MRYYGCFTTWNKIKYKILGSRYRFIYILKSNVNNIQYIIIINKFHYFIVIIVQCRLLLLFQGRLIKKANILSWQLLSHTFLLCKAKLNTALKYLSLYKLVQLSHKAYHAHSYTYIVTKKDERICISSRQVLIVSI